MTKKESVKALLKQILSKLEHEKLIEFSPRLRQEIWDDLYSKIGNWVLSDEDLREKVIQKLNEQSESLKETAVTESDQFKAGLKFLKEQLGEHQTGGIYYQKPLRMVAQGMVDFLMSSKKIEDVYETDDVLVQKIVESMQKFNPQDLH